MALLGSAQNTFFDNFVFHLGQVLVLGPLLTFCIVRVNLRVRVRVHTGAWARGRGRVGAWARGRVGGRVKTIGCLSTLDWGQPACSVCRLVR